MRSILKSIKVKIANMKNYLLISFILTISLTACSQNSHNTNNRLGVFEIIGDYPFDRIIIDIGNCFEFSTLDKSYIQYGTKWIDDYNFACTVNDKSNNTNCKLDEIIRFQLKSRKNGNYEISKIQNLDTLKFLVKQVSNKEYAKIISNIPDFSKSSEKLISLFKKLKDTTSSVEIKHKTKKIIDKIKSNPTPYGRNFCYDEFNKVIATFKNNDLELLNYYSSIQFKSAIEKDFLKYFTQYVKDVYGTMNSYSVMAIGIKPSTELYLVHADYSNSDTVSLLNLNFERQENDSLKLLSFNLSNPNYHSFKALDNIGNPFFENILNGNYDKIYNESSHHIKSTVSKDELKKALEKLEKISSYKYFNHLFKLEQNLPLLGLVYEVQYEGQTVQLILTFIQENGEYKFLGFRG